MKRIILTGGGTAGHVTPNIALLPRLKELNYDIHYIGSYNGIEKELIEQFGIPYHGISTGKLRRYFSVQNFTDPFRVIKGLGEANTPFIHTASHIPENYHWCISSFFPTSLVFAYFTEAQPSRSPFLQRLPLRYGRIHFMLRSA